jgi:hypothetical protein
MYPQVWPIFKCSECIYVTVTLLFQVKNGPTYFPDICPQKLNFEFQMSIAHSALITLFYLVSNKILKVS